MQKEDYQKFKEWFASVEDVDGFPKIPTYPWGDKMFTANDVVGWLYAANMNMIGDPFTSIKEKRFDNLVKFKQGLPRKADNRTRVIHEALFPFYFAYVGASYEEFCEYEATSVLSSYDVEYTLFIHQGNIACIKYRHPIIDVSALIITDADEPITAHASYCTKCGLTFMHKSEYMRLRKKYPFLVARFCEIGDDGFSLMQGRELSAESVLMLCGYSVRHRGPSAEYRYQILENVIYNGILSRTEVIQYLEHFIKFNGGKPNMEEAKEKWENDLRFIRKQGLVSVPPIKVGKIKPYSRKFRR